MALTAQETYSAGRVYDADGRMVVTSTGSGYPAGATVVTAASGNVANAGATATLAAAAGKTTYITGFEATGSGATAASVVNCLVTGLTGSTLTYTFAVPAGVTVGCAPLVVQFPIPIPASAVNSSVSVILAALGAGNTNAAVVAHGYQV